MEELKRQQKEALKVASQYCDKLIPGIENVINELKGEKLPDTDEFLKHILDGVNWIIGVFNGTKDLINADFQVIDKENVNQSVVAFNTAVNDKNDQKIVVSLSEILVFIKNMKSAAEKIGA